MFIHIEPGTSNIINEYYVYVWCSPEYQTIHNIYYAPFYNV